MIPKGYSKAVNGRTDKTRVKKRQTMVDKTLQKSKVRTTSLPLKTQVIRECL
jgi:hypothetical protein